MISVFLIYKSLKKSLKKSGIISKNMNLEEQDLSNNNEIDSLERQLAERDTLIFSLRESKEKSDRNILELEQSVSTYKELNGMINLIFN